MKTINKTALLTVALISISANVAQAAVTNFTFNGSWVMFDGYDPTFSNPDDVLNNGNGIAGDPFTGVMQMDLATGAGTAAITISQPFFGSPLYERSFTMYSGPNGIAANMLFDWGGPATTSCGLANCNISVTNIYRMTQIDSTHFRFTTIDSSMPNGPGAGFQPTFNGIATVVQDAIPTAVPVPASVWLLGSGLLGLMGMARRKLA